MEELTSRQAEILQMIRDFIDENGYPPTRAEIAEILGFRSVNAAEDHLKALERKGAIEIAQGASRGIRILEEESGLPIIGRVAAGNPILAEQYIESYCDVDPKMFKPRAHYLLKVRGMSMRDVGIMDGDLLAVHKTKTVRNGQIVVARVDGEVTVKRFRKKGKRVELLPENTEFDPIVVDDTQDLEIEGLGVGVIRRGIE